MRSLTCLVRRNPATPTYQLTDRLHEGRTVRVPAEGITGTVSGWLADFGVRSPLVDDLARLVRDGEWVAAHAVAERLSVEVTVARLT